MDSVKDLNPYFFYIIGGFVGFIFLFEAARQAIFASDGSDQHRTRRLKALSKGISTEDLLAKYRQSRPSRWQRLPFFGNIPAKMRQAGMTIQPRLFMMICALAASSVFVSTQSILGAPLALLAGFGLSIALPMVIINTIRQRRIDKFAKQLPDALDLMKRGLTVGHPLNVTIANVARTMPDPIGTEFGLLADQITYGDSLPAAMMELAKRIDQEDFFYLSVSIDIQHGAGGNLAAMLGTLSAVIRRRYAMRRRIHAISSEGRISAIILSLLPAVMYGGTTLMAPTYFSSVSDDPMFKPIVATILLLVAGNALLLRRLVTFKI